MMKIFGQILRAHALLVTFVLSCGTFSETQANTFFTKNSKGEFEKFSVDLAMDDQDRVHFSSLDEIKKLTSHPEALSSSPVVSRPPNKIEDSLNTALMLALGLTLLGTSDSYDLSEDLVLSSYRGVFFFVFPVEVHSLYRRCGQKEVLIASTTHDEKSARESGMMSLEEAESSCAEVPSSEPS